MGRPGLDAARYMVEYTGIPLSPEEAMASMEQRQEELFQKVCLFDVNNYTRLKRLLR